VRRGEIWWASLPDPRGSERGYRRPVLIVQADAFNRSKIGTVIVGVISSNLTLSEAPGNLFFGRKDSGLKKDSVADVSQLITLDKRHLAGGVSKPTSKIQSILDEGLRLVLSV
jgi:mRNA interferase MazF